jgi:uncharacterized Zn-binding protein involved in type VI secretion
MFPAARKGDPITHDMLVPSGVIGPPVTGPCPPPMGPVMIEGLPAAHVNCTVVCSGATSAGPAHPPPVPPAPPPPIVTGSQTVFIHNMPAARWAPSGDVGACGVFLGDPKLAAARTVLIGGPTGAGGSVAMSALGVPPTRPPTIAELQNDPVVQQALEQAWNDSQPADPANRHEEGGWIFMDATTGRITIQRAPRGARASINVNNPPNVPGSVPVGTFHTHPNPTAEGWDPGPSGADTRNATRRGVPTLIRADDGVHSTGPNARRGGLGGGSGFPP